MVTITLGSYLCFLSGKVVTLAGSGYYTKNINLESYKCVAGLKVPPPDSGEEGFELP